MGDGDGDGDGGTGMEDYTKRVDVVASQVNKIEQKVDEVEQFYLNNRKKQANTSKGGSASKDKDKDKEKHVQATNQQEDATSREEAASQRMQELICQFGKILHQITQHKWAWPFMEPVDVKGLGLDDYYEIIEKPMDFSTIKKQMEAKDGGGYKHVREVCADVRLVFKNAMKYNDEKNDFHVMAKTLLAKFEEKWIQFYPKVVEEEKRLREEESEEQHNVLRALEASYAKMARDISNELSEAVTYLDDLRKKLVQKCRKMTTKEKRQLSSDLTKISSEDLCRALEIVAQENPDFVIESEEVDLDLDAQSDTTLWRLKVFVKDALEKDALQSQGQPAASMGGNNNNDNTENTNVNNNSKRKREISDAALKSSNKKSKK